MLLLTSGRKRTFTRPFLVAKRVWTSQVLISTENLKNICFKKTILTIFKMTILTFIKLKKNNLKSGIVLSCHKLAATTISLENYSGSQLSLKIAPAQCRYYTVRYTDKINRVAARTQERQNIRRVQRVLLVPQPVHSCTGTQGRRCISACALWSKVNRETEKSNILAGFIYSVI